MIRRLLCLFSLLLLLPAPAAAGASGNGTLRGKVNYREEPLQGAVVRLFTGNEGGFRRAADFEAPPTAADGLFEISLPAGRYFLVVEKRAAGGSGELEPGDFYAYYGGNPVVIGAGSTINVGVNCSPLIDSGGVRAEGGTGIRGRVYADGAPLGRARVTLYRDGDTIFRGIGYATAMTNPQGRFSFNLESGSYYLVARKRAGNERMGPLAAGDLFAFAHENPIPVDEGAFTLVALNAMPKLMKVKEEGQAVTLDGTGAAGETMIRGTVTGAGGKPLRGVYVTAYRDSMMIYKPDFISNITGEDGKYAITFTGGGEYFIIARDTLGGPAEKGDLLGRYDGNEDHSVRLETGESITGIDITAEIVE